MRLAELLESCQVPCQGNSLGDCKEADDCSLICFLFSETAFLCLHGL